MTYQITHIVNEYTGNIPNRVSDTPTQFADNIYSYQVWIDVAVKDINNVVKDMNTLISETNGYANSAYNYKNETLKYRNDAQNSASGAASDRSRAENAANRAEAVVIPTEATYSLVDLESALNNLLTYQVAQAAQISILKQGA